MRWLPLLALAGCVPVSSDEFAGGEPAAEARDDASVSLMDSAVSMDAAEVTSMDASPMEASIDAASSVDASAHPSEPFTCAPGMLCDDFELGLMCPIDPAPRWSECEHIDDVSGPTIFPLADQAGHVLLSRVDAGPTPRSQRLLRYVPLEADYFEADFWLYGEPSEPSENAYYTFVKLQQEAGKSASGAPLQYPGVSLVARSNVMALVIETVERLDEPIVSSPFDLRPMPSGWIQVHLEVEFGSALKVAVSFEDLDKTWRASVAPNQVALGRQYFTLGIYTEAAGAAALLFDDVQAHAERDGQLIALP